MATIIPALSDPPTAPTQPAMAVSDEMSTAEFAAAADNEVRYLHRDVMQTFIPSFIAWITQTLTNWVQTAAVDTLQGVINEFVNNAPTAIAQEIADNTVAATETSLTNLLQTIPAEGLSTYIQPNVEKSTASIDINIPADLPKGSVLRYTIAEPTVSEFQIKFIFGNNELIGGESDAITSEIGSVQLIKIDVKKWGWRKEVINT